jgi:hypothetical protein
MAHHVELRPRKPDQRCLADKGVLGCLPTSDPFARCSGYLRWNVSVKAIAGRYRVSIQQPRGGPHHRMCPAAWSRPAHSGAVRWGGSSSNSHGNPDKVGHG